MIVPFTAHSWLNTAHGIVFGGGYIVLIVLALVAVAWLQTGELTPFGRKLTERQVGMTVLAAAVMAWIAVATGTWVSTPGSATSREERPQPCSRARRWRSGRAGWCSPRHGSPGAASASPLWRRWPDTDGAPDSPLRAFCAVVS